MTSIPADAIRALIAEALAAERERIAKRIREKAAGWREGIPVTMTEIADAVEGKP